MELLTKTLAPSKTQKVRGYLFDRSASQILIQAAKTTLVYDLAEVPVPENRLFRLRKAEAGGDADSDCYDVVCGRGRVSCDCKGFIFGGDRGCKHADAVRELVREGSL